MDIPTQQAQKPKAVNRRERRKMVKRDGSGGMYSRFTSSARTGTTPHFARWKAEGQIKSALQRITLHKLINYAADAKTQQAYRIVQEGTGLRNVWQLSVAERKQLLAVPGMGPAKLRLIHADLSKHSVRLAWEA